MATITIRKGNQYEPDGYRITDGTLSSFGATRGDGYTVDGTLWPWCLPNEAEIDAAIKATLSDGQTRIIEAKATRSDVVVADHDTMPTGRSICPKCGTYCCGDCEVAE